MPANLTPQYLDAEQRFKQATTPAERLSALEDMWATLPKHKGTEKLQAEIKKKLSLARKEQQTKKGPKRLDPSNIPREGAGRVVLTGPPNGGKSALLKALTRAEPEVAPYAFTTREPQQGMLEWQDIQFQLIDLPALSRQFMEPWVMNVIRSADLLLMAVDQSSAGVLEEIEDVAAFLAEQKVFLQAPAGELPRGGVVMPSLLLLNKMDLAGAGDNAAVVEELFGGRFAVRRVSAETGEGLEPLKDEIFTRLGIIRVYTKQPGKPPDQGRPYVLKIGSTVLDLCQMVHHDFVEHLAFARVWGKHTFEGQRINRDHVLTDGDVIELHR
ncbi:MAG TPA: 50S ribosome-binding GTPase [Acidobacteriota bacterium]|nr:TGS domain-containing protein [Acidobacteriota bacterium]HOT00397.1 50S ribosome-binding GTPase [Acidobacteriota bacterium]HQF86164.1 50S ribosome-binding GTPase [Acidobacteriota bacterium]HQG90592.1 50S ribosome-binding GTPase [Acidobacteriota bacterium]HQK86606.1 50S ribosome-binding GTPase [Acidobacteriota bacterium]